MELDTAAAKVDELTKQLESLWSDSPTPVGSQAGAPSRVSLFALVPTLAPKASCFLPGVLSHRIIESVGYLRAPEGGDQWKWTSNRTLGRTGPFPKRQKGTVWASLGPSFRAVSPVLLTRAPCA